MTPTQAMLNVIDFVEELGGTLDQDERAQLVALVQEYSREIFNETLGGWDHTFDERP
jgi:hypothetical protein